MPIHDWSRLNPACFHSFYLSWVATISRSMKNGVLPSSHYSLIENQRDGRSPTFVEFDETSSDWIDPGKSGGLLSALDVPPRASFHDLCTQPEYAEKVITVRRCDFDQVVAAIRIVAQDTKRSKYRTDQFVAWTVEVLREGISVLIVDLFPPSAHSPHGIHKAIWDQFVDNDFTPPSEKPLTLASYLAKPYAEAYVEPTAVGLDLVDMPLFLDSDSYVNVPLAATYQETFQAEPKHWRDALSE